MRGSNSAVAVALVALLGSSAHATTVDRVPVGNGVGVATVRVADGRLDGFFDAPYQSLDVGQPTRDLLFDAYVGARVNGGSRWLDVAPESFAAVDDMNAYVVVHREGPLLIRTTLLSPFGLNHPAVLAAVDVENTSATAATASFVTLANFHVGGGADGTAGEEAVYDAARDAIREIGERTVVAFALGGSSGHLMTPQNPFPIVENNLAIPASVDGSGVRDDVVHGFVFAPAGGSIAAGAHYGFGVLYAAPSSQSFFRDVDGYLAGRSAAAVVEAERQASVASVAAASLPSSLSADERRLAGQQLALLRAAQVRGRVDGGLRRRPNGQIVASLPPGIWNITWARDLAYATRGLLDVDKDAEAAAALRFMLDGDAGSESAFVGRDYLISITRYFGGGGEETDRNAGGPNIEWDDFGLFLQVYSQALAKGIAVDDRLGDVKSGVADVLLSLMGDDGLLVADSSIWETHWEPTFESQGRQQFTYSSAMAAAGLAAFADVLDARGDGDAAVYRGAAATLRAGVRAHLVDDASVLAACREELDAGGAYLDAAVVEAFNTDVLRDAAVEAATLDALTGLAAVTGGYYRNDAGGEYDSREWIVVDLWMAKALRRAGRVDESNGLIDIVTQRGLDELGLIPELINEDGRADGAFPMMGFGAGAYLSALVDRAADLNVVAGEGEGEGDIVVGEGEGEVVVGEGEGDVVGEGEGEVVVGEGEGDGGVPNDDDDGVPAAKTGCGASADGSALALAALLLISRRRAR